MVRPEGNIQADIGNIAIPSRIAAILSQAGMVTDQNLSHQTQPLGKLSLIMARILILPILPQIAIALYMQCLCIGLVLA